MHPHAPEGRPAEIIVNATQYVDGIENLAGILPLPTPRLSEVIEVATDIVAAAGENPASNSGEISPNRSAAAHLANAALLYSGVENLRLSARSPELPAEVRRQAILIARAALARRAHLRRRKPITRLA